MMAAIYLDDIYLTSDEQTNNYILYNASYLAAFAANVETHLVGNPPMFRPSNPSLFALTEFIHWFKFFVQQLSSAANDASTNH